LDNNRGRKSNVKIHEDANGVIYTMGVTMKPVNSAQDVRRHYIFYFIFLFNFNA